VNFEGGEELATLDWIQVDAGLRFHPKAIALSANLGDPRAHTYLVDLWTWAAKSSPDGRITGKAATAIIEGAVGWTGKRGALVDALVQERWLDVVEDGFYIHDWHDWAGAHIEKAEKEALRKRASREQRKTSADVRRTSAGRPQDVQEKGADCPGGSSPLSLSFSEKEEVQEEKEKPEELQAAWNELAPGLPRWVEMSKKRERQARARLRERVLSQWRDVITRIARSKFCSGENDRGWSASPDWLLQPDTAAKVLEGKYDNRGAANTTRQEGTNWMFREMGT
jgi:hypothetical protein